MSLGGKLAELKKKHVSNVQEKFVDSLVISEDVFSIELFLRLKKMNNDTCIIFSKELSENSLRTFGPHLVRGEENIRVARTIFTELESTEVSSKSKFYKDNKFRTFGGRSKSEPLIDGEDYFTFPYLELEDSKYLLHTHDELFKVVQENDFLTPTKIELEDGRYRVQFSNGLIVTANKLYWGDAPVKFLDIIEDKDSLGEEFHKYIDSTKASGELFIKLFFDEEISDMKETIFIAQSLTHEWGHFIGDFKTENDEQTIEFLVHVDPEESSEAEISSKIRLAKKGIEKIFPGSKKKITKDFITFKSNGVTTNIFDTDLNHDDKLKNLKFIGHNAALLESSVDRIVDKVALSEVSYLSRALLSIKQALV